MRRPHRKRSSRVTHTHKTVRVRHADMSARIDENIAPLIREIWRADILTVCSCEDVSESDAHGDALLSARENTVGITFESANQAREFLNIVTRLKGCGESLSDRICQHGCRNGGPAAWGYELQPVIYDHGKDSMRGFDLDFFVRVYFPRDDVPLLVDRLRTHNSSTHANDRG